MLSPFEYNLETIQMPLILIFNDEEKLIGTIYAESVEKAKTWNQLAQKL